MKLMIFDGNSIINRAFYAIRLLTNSKGQPTNAVYGFLNIFLKFIEDEKPDCVCAAFDLPGGTFRNEMYSGYKIKRKGMPDELAAQLPVVKEILSAMNVPCLECAGFEADDIIGTVARLCEKQNVSCDIVTGDRDDLQLVSDKTNVLLITTKGGQTLTTRYNPEEVEKNYGLKVSQLIDLKALWGDASDNIPGVAGIGEKTAASLLQKYGTLDEIYKEGAIDKEKAGVKNKLIAGRDMAYLSRTLGTIRTDAPISFSPGDARISPYDTDRLYAILSELELKAFITRLGLKPEKKETDAPGREKYEALPYDDSIIKRIQNEGVMYYIMQSEHTYVLCGEAVYKCKNEALGALFCDKTVKKRAYDIKRDMTKLGSEELRYLGGDFDFMLAAYVADPALPAGGFFRAAGRFLESGISPMGDIYESEDDACEALVNMPALYEKMCDHIEKNGQHRLFYDIEMPLAGVLFEMEREGMYIDADVLDEIGRELSEAIERSTREIYDIAGEEFNIGSPKQLGTILFERLGLPVLKKTKTGYSTDAETLEKLAPYHPIIDKILEYRQKTKLSSTYIEGLKKARDADGYLHTCFNQALTHTGRLSSTEPNLQNIPVRLPEGRRIRKAFVCEREGYEYLSADYSQIELRVLAGMSGDETMTRIFSEGGDIHTATAAQVWGVKPQDVTPEMRSGAKAVNFGIVYGISGFTLAGNIGVSVKQAKEYIDSYFKTFGGVRRYLDEVVKRAKEDGYVKTKFGRVRFIDELKSSNKNVRAFGERVALNTPIQGTAADIIKLAMVNVDRALKKEGLETKLVLQIHDELVLLAKDEELSRASEILVREMENVCDIGVPLKVSVSHGRSWYDAK
ncbi:MAG: DNA polymerase I [Clostridia bacterium]|nr:DNA polymerase I [Clostridia bacterium]